MRLPDQDESSLFWGAAVNPAPGTKWIILLFDGLRITAFAYRYTRVWGLYIMAKVEDKEINVLEKIKQKNPDDKKLKQYVDFGNCPPEKIAFEDWLQSTAETAQNLVNQLAPGRGTRVIILSTHPTWAGKIRMTRLYNKMGINPQTPSGQYLAAEVAKKGKEKISQGKGPGKPAVDQNYFLHVIKIENEKPRVTREFIFREGKPLESVPNSDKNRSQPLRFTPFLNKTGYFDLIFTKSKGNKNSLVGVYRVKTGESPIELYAAFEPGHDMPTLIIPEGKDFEMLKGVTSVPPVRMDRHQKPSQVLALIDATMPANLLEPVKAKLIEAFGTLSRENTKAELGLVIYGDYSEGSNREVEFEVKDIPPRFMPIKEWVKTCEKEVSPVKPADFMAALDKGLKWVSRFPWKSDAKKYLVLIFCHPPHPPNNPDRDIYKSTFTLAENNWYYLLTHLHEKKNIELYALNQPKDIPGEKAAEIKQEIEIACQGMKKVGISEQGLNPLEEIVTSIINQTVGDYRIEPDTYQIPLIREEEK